MQGTSYVHMLEGRLRIKVSEIKRAPERAKELKKTVSRLKGVSHVRANDITGNVLVLFDPDHTNHYHIIGRVKDLGCLNEKRTPPRRSSTDWSDAVVGPLAQLVIQRAILALILGSGSPFVKRLSGHERPQGIGCGKDSRSIAQ
jgi:hypothetical protein